MKNIVPKLVTAVGLIATIGFLGAGELRAQQDDDGDDPGDAVCDDGLLRSCETTSVCTGGFNEAGYCKEWTTFYYYWTGEGS